jgi:membrane-associated phospholipid phosphatase
MGLPDLMLWIALGAMVALGIVTVVNRWWKISAHLTGMGGLLGGVCSYALYYSMLPSSLLVFLLLAALLLMYARIYLEAHTPLQVVCGMLVGLVSTFVPSMIMIYA